MDTSTPTPDNRVLVDTQGGKIDSEAAVTARGERISLCEHLPAPVAGPVAEHHRGGNEPQRTERLRCGEQAVTAGRGADHHR